MDVENFPKEKILREKQRRKELENLIESRMYELRATQVLLAERAKRYNRYSILVKAFVIILGALVATKETFSMLVGISNIISIIGYTIAGVLIAVLTGLEATFGWGTNAAKLATLAGMCREARQRCELDRVKGSSEENPIDANLALEKLLNILVTKLSEVRSEAIKSGLNPVANSPSAPPVK